MIAHNEERQGEKAHLLRKLRGRHWGPRHRRPCWQSCRLGRLGSLGGGGLLHSHVLRCLRAMSSCQQVAALTTSTPSLTLSHVMLATLAMQGCALLWE